MSTANLLVVSDLHFGEELLPGATVERRAAVALASTAFREFLRHHAARRLDGKPWRLVIAGDLFDFMSVMIPARANPGERLSRDRRELGEPRTTAFGVDRLARIAIAHRELLADLVKFAAAGHAVDLVVGNHDIELLAAPVAAELARQLAAVGAEPAVLARIKVVPWFVHVPGVAWIEHGHVYDEGCSFEFNLAPTDPEDGTLVFNADYAAVRYLGSAVPELDPHGVEEWGFWGFMRYAWSAGWRSLGHVWLAYGRFVLALFAARGLHRSHRRRDRRRREHRDRLARVAADGGLPLDAARAIDRLARAPMTYSFRRVARMLMLDRFGLGLGTALVAIACLAFAPGWGKLVGIALAIGGAIAISRWLGAHYVTSQLPMRAIPERIRRHVDAPFVVFGHTHDPRWQPLADGGVYINSGTWLPATRPGLRRSFTHVLVRSDPPRAELRQWREGGSHRFDVGDVSAAFPRRSDSEPGIPPSSPDTPAAAR